MDDEQVVKVNRTSEIPEPEGGPKPPQRSGISTSHLLYQDNFAYKRLFASISLETRAE